MDNTVLQKLLHSHVLFWNDEDKWRKTFIQPSHVMGGYSTVTEKMPAKVMHDFLKFHANRIQQSMKFYIPSVDADNTLTKDELMKLGSDLKMFLPFRSTFVQQEAEAELQYEATNEINTQYVIQNVYLEDVGFQDDEDSQIFKGNISLYIKNTNEFYFDPNDYYFSYRENGDYTFWLPDGSPFKNYTDLRGDNNDQYNNATLNAMVNSLVSTHYTLALLLTYPQIVNKQDVLGITPANAKMVPFSKKFSSSEFLRKPKYEHKVLKLDLFGANDTGKKGSTGVGGSRAFHAVRKHIRQYSDGKITFVKAHFRGSKDVGLVTKDYEIVNRSK
jgi:hypothetical protein